MGAILSVHCNSCYYFVTKVELPAKSKNPIILLHNQFYKYVRYSQFKKYVPYKLLIIGTNKLSQLIVTVIMQGNYCFRIGQLIKIRPAKCELFVTYNNNKNMARC